MDKSDKHLSNSNFGVCGLYAAYGETAGASGSGLPAELENMALGRLRWVFFALCYETVSGVPSRRAGHAMVGHMGPRGFLLVVFRVYGFEPPKTI